MLIKQIGTFIEYTKRNGYAWIAFILIISGFFYDGLSPIGLWMVALHYFGKRFVNWFNEKWNIIA